MRSLIFVLLGFLLVNGSNNLSKCSEDQQNPDSTCPLCDRTPCKCEQLALEEADGKISVKRLILLFLKKANAKCSNPETCQECRHCRHTCPKTNVIAKLLRDILNKATCGKEEESIRDIIIKLLHPSECEKNPCQIHCDPRVQAVLSAILKKGTDCKCKECDSYCHMNRNPCKHKIYKYWFKASKDAIQKDVTNTHPSHLDKQKLTSCEQKEEQIFDCPDAEDSDEFMQNEKFGKCKTQCCKTCKVCQRPDKFICPRQETEDCSKRARNNLFSICADCGRCSIISRNSKNYVTVSCEDCMALNSPFVQFTRNGYPFRQALERQNGIQVRARFLQVNDYRSNEGKPSNTIFNPFHPKCNIPSKKKNRYKRVNIR